LEPKGRGIGDSRAIVDLIVVVEGAWKRGPRGEGRADIIEKIW